MKKPPIPKLVLSVIQQPFYEEEFELSEDFKDCNSREEIESRVDDLFYVRKEELSHYISQELENRQEIIDYLCDVLKDNIAVFEAKIKKKAEIDEKKKMDRELKELARLKKKYEKFNRG